MAPFHPSSTSSSSCVSSSNSSSSDEEEEDARDGGYYTRTRSTSTCYTHVPPRVGSKHQIATLPLTDFLGQGAVMTAAAAAFRAEGPLMLPSARHLFLNKPTTTAAASSSSSSTAPWSSTEMQVFAQAFFEKPRDWQYICDALLAAGEGGRRDISEVVAFFWGIFMRTAIYERWLRASAHAVPFVFTEQQLYQQEIDRQEHSGTPPTPASSSPSSSSSSTNSNSPTLYLDGPANGKDGSGGNSGIGTTNGGASPMEGVEVGGAEHEKDGKGGDSTGRAQQKHTSAGLRIDDAFESAFSHALHEHGKGNWGEIRAAIVGAKGTDGMPAETDEAEACLEEYFRSTYRHNSAYVSYLLSSPAHRDQCAEAHAHELPPSYHDHRLCSWCDEFFDEGDRLVCCESCPNVAHKRNQCAGKVLAKQPWHCETCKRAFKKAKGPEVKEEAIRRTRFFYEAAEAKRRQALDLIIARQAATALRRLEEQEGVGMEEEGEEESYEVN